MAASLRLAGLLSVLGFAATPAVAQVDFTPVTDPIGNFLTANPDIPGVSLLVIDFDGHVVWEQNWGAYDRSTSIPIASATKWYSGALIMSLVDTGHLSLDEAVSAKLPALNGFDDLRETFTIRQAFSHTAGSFSSSDLIGRDDLTLEEAAAAIAQLPNLMRNDPGTAYRYGGNSMHLAGRAGEVAGGEPWVDLFAARITEPLNLPGTAFGAAGTLANPRIAGGAFSSAEDLASFGLMLALRGRLGETRVLSTAAADEMLTDQTGFGLPGGAVPRFVPPTLNEYLGYGVGIFITRRNDAGTPTEWVSAGAYGTTAWINFETETIGVFVIEDDLSTVDPYVDDLRDFVQANLRARLPGDATGDRRVDLNDFIVLRNHFGDTGDTTFDDGDFNRDGTVDLQDFTILRNNFGTVD